MGIRVAVCLLLTACGGAVIVPSAGPNTMTLDVGGADRPPLRDVLARLESKAAVEARDRSGRVEDIPRARGERIAPPLRTARFATLAEGETLSQLSLRVLNTSKRWQEIADLNGIDDPARIRPGTRLQLPPEDSFSVLA